MQDHLVYTPPHPPFSYPVNHVMKISFLGKGSRRLLFLCVYLSVCVRARACVCVRARVSTCITAA